MPERANNTRLKAEKICVSKTLAGANKIWYYNFVERYLCLDIGDKRIGVAVSDPFNSYALPVETIFRQNLKKDLDRVEFLIKQKFATHLVCGMPVNFDGTPSVQTGKAKYFIQKLQERLNITVIEVDERCTTCEAEEILISQGKSRQERKQFVDSLAATTILESYLREIKNKKEKIMAEEKNCTGGCGEDVCDCEHDDVCECEVEDEVIELTTDDGKVYKMYLVGTIEYKGKTYSAFEPAEEIEGISEDDIIIFEVVGNEESAELLPVEDEKLLDEVFEEFCKALDEEEA